MDLLVGRLDQAPEVGGILLGTSLGQLEARTLDQPLAISNLFGNGQFTDGLPIQLVQLGQ